MSNNNIVPIRGGQDDAPERPKDAYHKDGYVYVIEFSDGTLKVGKASDLRSRLSGHRHDASKFGFSIAQWWGSRLHRGHEESERRLIAFCKDEGGFLQGGREYFTAVGFRSAVAFAESLPMRPTPQDQVESETERSEAEIEEFARSLFPNSKYPRIYVDSWMAAFALGVFFDPTEKLPAMTGDLTPAIKGELVDMAEKIASDQDVPVSEIMHWGSYEWMCYLLDLSVQSAKLGMQIRIREEGREDLHEAWLTGGAAS